MNKVLFLFNFFKRKIKKKLNEAQYTVKVLIYYYSIIHFLSFIELFYNATKIFFVIKHNQKILDQRLRPIFYLTSMKFKETATNFYSQSIKRS